MYECCQAQKIQNKNFSTIWLFILAIVKNDELKRRLFAHKLLNLFKFIHITSLFALRVHEWVKKSWRTLSFAFIFNYSTTIHKIEHNGCREMLISYSWCIINNNNKMHEICFSIRREQCEMKSNKFHDWLQLKSLLYKIKYVSHRYDNFTAICGWC